MILIMSGFGLPLPLEVLGPPRVRAKATKTEGHAFPMLFRLYERQSGTPCRENGRLIEMTGTDLAAAREHLLCNRDPRRFEVRIDAPRIPG